VRYRTAGVLQPGINITKLHRTWLSEALQLHGRLSLQQHMLGAVTVEHMLGAFTVEQMKAIA
jgi:hypothetical protein